MKEKESSKGGGEGGGGRLKCQARATPTTESLFSASKMKCLIRP